MALPQEFEVYGAAPASSIERRSTKAMRIAFVAGAVVLTMLAAVAFLAKDTEEASRVEDIALVPNDKLKHLISYMAEHSGSMTIPEMEAKLSEWKKNPNALLKLPDKARTQVRSDKIFDFQAMKAHCLLPDVGKYSLSNDETNDRTRG